MVTTRTVLLRELNSIIGLLPNFRRTAAAAEARFRQNKAEDTFREFVEAEFSVRMIEERLNFIHLVLDEADE